MPNREINISNPGSDNMGDSFRVLLEVLEQMEAIEADDEIIIDLSQLTFVHPFLTLPLCALVANIPNNNDRVEIKYGGTTSSYLETIKLFEDRIEKALQELRGMDTCFSLGTKSKLEGYVSGMLDAYLVLTGVDYIPLD